MCCPGPPCSTCCANSWTWSAAKRAATTVSAVNGLLIGASNQLGEFESGITAHWFGTVPAVVMGGIGTLLVTGAWIKLFPTLANRDRMHVPVDDTTV